MKINNILDKFNKGFNKSKSIEITKNKIFEIQSMYSVTYDVLDFIIHFSIMFKGSDHAGPEFYIQIGRFYFEISIRDKRHWDYDNNKWDEPIENKLKGGSNVE